MWAFMKKTQGFDTNSDGKGSRERPYRGLAYIKVDIKERGEGAEWIMIWGGGGLLRTRH